MKRIILSVVSLLMCLGALAQKIKFTNTTNTWSMIDSTMGCCIPYPTNYSTAKYTGKVNYNGYTYMILQYDFGSCMVREAGSQVYVIGSVDSTERLLYDFSLGLNDTIKQDYQYDHYTSWVSGIDSTKISGTWYKVWHFDGHDYNSYVDSSTTYQYNVIEGVGCTNGVYYPVAPYDYSAYSDQLLCFSNDMGLASGLNNAVTTYGYGYSGSFDNTVSCGDFHPERNPHYSTPEDPTLKAAQVAKNSGNVVVAPNPVGDNGALILPYSFATGTLQVTDGIGRMVVNSRFTDRSSLAIDGGDLAHGIYVYRVTDNASGKVFTGKFSK